MSYIVGNRIPYEYFLTKGKGQSDVYSKGLPYETGSYDAALTKAGIQNANIIEYTSVMSPISTEIPKKDGLKRLKWGEVLECIKASSNGKKGEFVSAAVITTEIIGPDSKYCGGFACEYSGDGSREETIESLRKSIEGIIVRRRMGHFVNGLKMFQKNKTTKGYTVTPGYKFVYESLKIRKNYGSVLAAICFVSYKMPILNLNGI